MSEWKPYIMWMSSSKGGMVALHSVLKNHYYDGMGKYTEIIVLWRLRKVGYLNKNAGFKMNLK